MVGSGTLNDCPHQTEKLTFVGSKEHLAKLVLYAILDGTQLDELFDEGGVIGLVRDSGLRLCCVVVASDGVTATCSSAGQICVKHFNQGY